MIKILSFIFFFSFFSCDKLSKNNVITQTKSQNDQLKYYNISINKNKSLKERIKAVNKSYNISNKNDFLFPQIIHQKCFLHFSLNQYDSLLFYNKIILKKVSNNLSLGKQHHLIAYYFDEILYKSDSAFYHYNLAKNYSLKQRDHSRTGKNLMSMGLIQQNQNDFFGSKETITEALQYLHPQKDIKFIASSYNALATNHRKLLNYDDAIKLYNEAIKMTLSEKDKSAYKNNLATTYIDNKQYKKAISILEILSKDSLTRNSNKKYARVLDNLAYAKWLSGKNNSETEFVHALKIRVQNNDKRGQISSYTHLGEFFTKQNKRKAITYFDSVIQLSKKLKIPRAEKDALRYLMKIEENNVSIRDRYVLLNDSLYQQELKVKTQFAKYKYDDKLKQESILRLEKEKAEKETEIAQQKIKKIISYFGIVALLMGLGFIVYYYTQRSKRLKQENKTAKLEATFETEAQLSRRVHDDFGAELNHAMALVQNDADKIVLLDTLDALYNQSRDFSREINEIDTGTNYKSELLNMFATYTSNIKLYTLGTKEINWSLINELNKIVLFKVLRELMINMTKYSNATTVSIKFKKMPKLLKINYSDDGVGASKKELNIKNGLKITEKRIQAIGGTIIFDSEKGKGFKTEIEIPN